MNENTMENTKELLPDDLEMVAGGAEINDSLEGMERLESIRRAAMLREESLHSMRSPFGRRLQVSETEETVNKMKH